MRGRASDDMLPVPGVRLQPTIHRYRSIGHRLDSLFALREDVDNNPLITLTEAFEAIQITQLQRGYVEDHTVDPVSCTGLLEAALARTVHADFVEA